MSDEGMTGAKLSATGQIGAGTAEGGRNMLLFNAIPHVGMSGKSIFGCLGLSTSGAILDQASGANLGAMTAPLTPKTPGAILHTDKIGKSSGGPAIG